LAIKTRTTASGPKGGVGKMGQVGKWRVAKTRAGGAHYFESTLSLKMTL